MYNNATIFSLIDLASSNFPLHHILLFLWRIRFADSSDFFEGFITIEMESQQKEKLIKIGQWILSESNFIS